MQPTESMHEGIKDMVSSTIKCDSRPFSIPCVLAQVNKLGDTAIQVFSKHPQISLDAVRAIRKLISVGTSRVDFSILNCFIPLASFDHCRGSSSHL